MSITNRQIEALRNEAATAGDLVMVAICDLALHGYTDTTDLAALANSTVRNVEHARAECERVITDAQAAE